MKLREARIQERIEHNIFLTPTSLSVGVHQNEYNNNNDLRLMTVKTNHSTLHMVEQHTTVCQGNGSNDTTHRLSRRTATTRFSPEGIGSQKQTAPRFCQHPIRWAFTSQAFTRWRHLSIHPINKPATGCNF